MYQEKSIGEIFRHRREDLGVSLKDIESETSIRVPYLQAIEEGNIDQLISPAYARGFIKQYANYLGLDGDRIVREHRLFTGQRPQMEHLELTALNARKSSRNRSSFSSNLYWLGVTVAVVLVGYVLAKYLGIL